MGVMDLWADGQRAMSALGHTLDEADAERPVPACPGWTIRQVFAHQAGVVTDLLAGRVDGAGSDPWTAKQVADREELTLPQILDEWDEGAPELVAALRPVGEDIDLRLLMDLWHHHQDVRGALGQPGETSGPLTEWVIEHSQDFLQHLVVDAGLSVELGEAPEAPNPGVLTVEPFEAARGVVGRRSLDQIRAWSWGVDDPSDLVGTIPVFGPRPEPLDEEVSA